MLTYTLAQSALDAAVARARELQARAAIAIVDAAGNPIVLARLDGATFLNVDLAICKAYTAVSLRRSSALLEQMAADRPHYVQGLISRSGGRLVPDGGGYPIITSEGVVGAVGVSGGMGEQDELIAEAARAAIAAA
jgi:uncharacterized protein GlcG (DUF336 family)